MALLTPSVVRLGWGFVFVGLVVLLFVALRKWWLELGAIEELRSGVKLREIKYRNFRP